MVKNPPANAGDTGMWVQSLGQEDPLEKEMAPRSGILAWNKLHRQRSLVGCGPQGLKRVACDGLHTHGY